MTKKPTPWSVTSISCKCSWLEREANQPQSPITFDENERVQAGQVLTGLVCPNEQEILSTEG